MNLVFTMWAPKFSVLSEERAVLADLWTSYDGTELCSAAAEALRGLKSNSLFENAAQNIKQGSLYSN